MDNNLKTNKEVLLDFMTDIDCLEQLSPWIDDLNIFNVLKLTRTEIRHSNMLAWLLDPNENHGLGTSFLYGFIAKLPSILPGQRSGNMEDIDFLSLLASDLHSFRVEREWKDIDVLLASKEQKIVIAIENKIDSDLGKNQLNKYDSILIEKYSGWSWARILLAPDQSRFNEDTTTPSWGRMEYMDIVEVLDRCFDRTKSSRPEASILIENYLRLLKHDIIMEDPELSKICNAIYQKHKAALDLIINNIEDSTQPIADICRKWITQLKDNNQVVVENTRSNKYIKFRSKKLLDHFGVGAKDQDHFYNEIRIWLTKKEDKVGVKMCLVFYKDDKGLPAGMEEKMKEIMPEFKIERWKTVESKINYFDVEDYSEGGVVDFLNNSIAELDKVIPGQA